MAPDSRSPATRPAVAIAIVNQKDVRSTRRRCSGSGGVEVEAEERGVDPHTEHDPDDGRERDERLDLAVVRRREVTRVQGKKEDGEDPRDEPAEAVDRRVLPEPPELRLRAPSETSVEREQAVGDAFEVVYLLDVRAGCLADPAALRCVRDEWLEPRAEVVLRRAHDRDGSPERLLASLDGLVVQERHHGLSERHALDREEPVPAGVQLVDDDVGLAVALERLVVAQALDQDEVGVQALAGGDDVLGSLSTARRGRMEDDGPLASRRTGTWARSTRRRSRVGSPLPREPSGSRRTSRRAALQPSSRRRVPPGTSHGCRNRGSACTDFLREARRIGNCTERGTSVRPK